MRRFISNMVFVSAVLCGIVGLGVFCAIVSDVLFYRALHSDMLRSAAHVSEVLSSTGALPSDIAFADWQEQNGIKSTSLLCNAGNAPTIYDPNNSKVHKHQNGFYLAHWDGDDYEVFNSEARLFTTSITTKYYPIATVGAVIMASSVLLFIWHRFILRKQKQC